MSTVCTCWVWSFSGFQAEHLNYTLLITISLRLNLKQILVIICDVAAVHHVSQMEKRNPRKLKIMTIRQFKSLFADKINKYKCWQIEDFFIGNFWNLWHH